MDIWAASTLGAVRHDAAINIPAQVFVWMCFCFCLGSGVAGSCDNSLFSHLRNCQIALLSIYYFTFTVDEGSSFQLFLK